jgi:hypothetical protein
MVVTSARAKPVPQLVMPYATSMRLGSTRGRCKLFSYRKGVDCHGSSLSVDYDLLSDTKKTMIRPFSDAVECELCAPFSSIGSARYSYRGFTDSPRTDLVR